MLSHTAVIAREYGIPAVLATGEATPQAGPFSGATITWSYPEHLHERALSRVAAVRHAISVLLDDLEGSTTVDVQQARGPVY